MELSTQQIIREISGITYVAENRLGKKIDLKWTQNQDRSTEVSEDCERLQKKAVKWEEGGNTHEHITWKLERHENKGNFLEKVWGGSNNKK